MKASRLIFVLLVLALATLASAADKAITLGKSVIAAVSHYRYGAKAKLVFDNADSNFLSLSESKITGSGTLIVGGSRRHFTFSVKIVNDSGSIRDVDFRVGR